MYFFLSCLSYAVQCHGIVSMTKVFSNYSAIQPTSGCFATCHSFFNAMMRWLHLVGWFRVDWLHCFTPSAVGYQAFQTFSWIFNEAWTAGLRPVSRLPVNSKVTRKIGNYFWNSWNGKEEIGLCTVAYIILQGLSILAYFRSNEVGSNTYCLKPQTIIMYLY